MFSSCRATCPSSPGELGQGTWTTAGCRVTSSLSVTPRFQAGPDSTWPRAETRTWTRTWTRNLDKFYHVFSSCRATCPSSPEELGQGTWTTAGCRVTSSLSVTPPQLGPGRKPELGQELGQGTWTSFSTCFPLAEPLVQVRPGNLDKELGQLRAAVLQALSVLRPDSRQAPIPCASPRRKPELGQELGQGTWTNFITCFPLTEPLVQVRPELGQGTWTTAGCRVTSSLSITPRFQAGPDSVCLASLLEGVSEMDSIRPERPPGLVRPAFDLVLRRIRSLKRCVQACGCKIMTPRYAPQFGSRLHFKRCQPLPKETPFPFFSGTPFFGTPFYPFSRKHCEGFFF